MSDQSCAINSFGQNQIETVSLHPKEQVGDYQQAVSLAKDEAQERFEDYMLVSWYDRDRDFESPPNTTECAGDCKKDGYIHYGMNHGAKLKVDIEDGRFVFFFTPVEW
jgi:hypothetical protein